MQNPEFVIADDVMQSIFSHALVESPRECCGLIVNVADTQIYVQCQNLSASAHEQFVLSPDDFARAESRGEILAIVHSHPFASAEPSEADRVACESSGLPWLIVNPQTGAMVRIDPCGYVSDLLGRPFVYGVHDCYTLVVDYYRVELGIRLRHYVRDDRFGWWKDGKNLYMERFAESGFMPVDQPAKGDVILMQIDGSPVPNHIGVYLGGNLFMHHLVRQLSRRDVLDGYWQKHAVMFLRYREAAC